MARKKLEHLKKRKLTLTCKPKTIEFLYEYCDFRGISISQLLDDYAEELANSRKKVTRAKKLKKDVCDVVKGQMNIDDL